MAELHIERKERATWPWLLLGALLVSLVLWFLFGTAGDERDLAVADSTAAVVATTPATAATSDATTSAAVTAFTEFVQAGAPADAGTAHEYTSEGLRRLAAALAAVAERETFAGTADVSERVAEIRERADAMQRDPTSMEHALQAREAALLAAALMRNLTGEVATSARDAYATAERIAPDTPLLDQVETVRRFFDQSATAVRGLATM